LEIGNYCHASIFSVSLISKNTNTLFLQISLHFNSTNLLYRSIIWRLGGKHSNFTLGSNVEFSFQHHARYLSRSADGTKETISLYDNSAHGTENGHGHEVHLYPFSRGKIVEVNTKTWEATLVQAFHPPDNLLSKSQGSTQVLPGGNVLVNWGSSGALTEFLGNGTPIFHTYFDSGHLGKGVENYRGFRFNWTGIPNEEPAIVALRDEDGGGKTKVYVSWNGDTETKKWAFYGSKEGKGRVGKLKFLGEKERTGFETEFVVEEGLENVRAEAVGKNGKVLRSTGVVGSEIEVLRFQGKAEDDDMKCGKLGSWLKKSLGLFRTQEL
jgi:Arylsulfotransferase (ASST)